MIEKNRLQIGNSVIVKASVLEDLKINCYRRGHICYIHPHYRYCTVVLEKGYRESYMPYEIFKI